MTTKESILEKIRTLHWVLTWSGNWPPLDYCTQIRPNFDEEWLGVCGVPCPYIELGFNENRSLTLYIAEESKERAKALFREKFKIDPEFLARSGREYRARADADLEALREIRAMRDLASRSNAELAEFFMRARSHFYYNAMIDRYDFFMEQIFTPMLEEYLAKRLPELGKEEMIVEYTNTLITPQQVSVIFTERQDFFSIIKYIRGNAEMVRRIKGGMTVQEALASDMELKRRMEAYLAKWVWMPMLVNNPASTLESVWQEMGTYIIPDAPLRVKAKRLGDDYDESVIAKANEFMKELDPPQDIMHIIEGLRAMAFMRTEDYVVMSESSWCVIPIYTEIARRIGLTYADMKEFRPDEIVEHLNAGTKINAEDVRKRSAFNAYITFDGQQYFFEADEANVLKDALDERMRTAGETGTARELKGTIANKGKITGKVRVALDLKTINETKTGDILVVAAVASNSVVGIRNAAGIVSEYGGLTSHPVIVAREFNIPCIVGVKGATSILKDGDMVEVDADAGIVRIL